MRNAGRLLFGIMFSSREAYEEALNDLIEKFGEIEISGFEYNFGKFTPYYEKEMGKNIVKKIIIFKKKIRRGDLASVKMLTAEIEKKYAVNGKRRVNIDPGYLSDSELTLASFKKGTNYKEQASEKVWLHKVLEFKDGKVITFWHTFPDYKSREVREIIGHYRRKCLI
jgi:hypothetical protein